MDNLAIRIHRALSEGVGGIMKESGAAYVLWEMRVYLESVFSQLGVTVSRFNYVNNLI